MINSMEIIFKNHKTKISIESDSSYVNDENIVVESKNDSSKSYSFAFINEEDEYLKNVAKIGTSDDHELRREESFLCDEHFVSNNDGNRRRPAVNKHDNSVHHNYQQYNRTMNNSNKRENDNPYLNVWGHRTNIVDMNGRIQRVIPELNNYLAVYKARYLYYFDLVNGKYPQFVRRTDENMEIWRMSFNIYSTGFSDLITHIGKSFFQIDIQIG